MALTASWTNGVGTIQVAVNWVVVDFPVSILLSNCRCRDKRCFPRGGSAVDNDSMCIALNAMATCLVGRILDQTQSNDHRHTALQTANQCLTLRIYVEALLHLS